MPRTSVITVLTGSELNGADQSISEWVGLDVPDDKWDVYVDLVGGVHPLSLFFETIENGWFEVIEEEDDMGPGMNDTYWQITTTNVDALRVEIHARLVKELGLHRSKKALKKLGDVTLKSKSRKVKTK